jgi:hypothetical protein
MDGEAPAKPKVPADLSAPGLIYRLRRRGWVLSWSPRSDLMERGYQGKTVRLWPSSSVPPQQSEPTRADWEVISAWCVRYQAEMLLWANGGVPDDPQSLFDGTIGSLIEIYQKHEKSPFRRLRYKTSLHYGSSLRALKTAIGAVRVKQVTFNDITTWQDKFADDGDDAAPRKGRSASLIGHLKRVVLFGALVLPKEAGCHDLCDVFAKMAESQLLGGGNNERTEYMTAAQCRLLRAKAHEMGRPSIALEQALAFELGVRQKDVIGEWIPVAYPGVSDITDSSRKWMMGFRWEEVDPNLILRHRLSKSLRGNKAVMDPKAGKLKAWDLNAYPMVMDELRLLVGLDDIQRADLPASGPMILREETGRPWNDKNFQGFWRKIATTAGIPNNIQNRDSRPGAATEADLAGAPIDKTQRGLGHSKRKTTEIYLREDLEVNRELAKLRVEKRKP